MSTSAASILDFSAPAHKSHLRGVVSDRELTTDRLSHSCFDPSSRSVSNEHPIIDLRKPCDNTIEAIDRKMALTLRTSPPKPTRSSVVGERIPARRHHVCPFNIRTCTGCRPPNHLNERQRLEHELVFWQTMADISGLKSPRLEWAQLKQSFVSSYWSMGVMASSKAYLHVFQWLAPHSNALNASRDALCLIHLGARYKDERLLFEGRTRHLAALRCMQEEVNKANAALDDCVLGAAYTLGHCEMYKIISVNGKGWRGHMGGFQQMLQLRGPKSIVTPFAHALLHNIRQVEVAHSFHNRQASYLSRPDGIEALPEICEYAWFRATTNALQVGAALEKADRLCAATRPTEASIVGLLNEMVKLEVEIKAFLMEIYNTWNDDFLPHRLVPTSTFGSFYDHCGGLTDVFPSSIDFPSFLAATSHVYVHCYLLLLRQAIADVARLHPYPLLSGKNQYQEALLNDAIDESATSLCQSIAFLQSNHEFAGVVSCGPPLHFAAEWYRRKQDQRKLLWCNHVRELLQSDVLLGGSLNTSLDIDRPVFTW